MHSDPLIEEKVAQVARWSQWQAFALVAACLLAVLAVFFPTFWEMVRIWERSQTFTHGFLVLPAFLYFAWQRRSELAATPPRPFAPAFLGVAIVGLVWLLGDLSAALTPSFFAMITLVPLVIIGVLGWRWAMVLSFPLAFLVFAVPFGEVFVPTLMVWTADFAVLALQVTGVPVLRDGPVIITPNGQWIVVAACSGIRYLIASMFVGALYAWLMYRSTLRRVLFFLASIAVPLVANWVRAYLIVLIGHLSNNRIATGVDHLIYGWIFFGIVIFILFAIGAVWREDDNHVTNAPAVRLTTWRPGLKSAGWAQISVASLAMTGLLAAFPIFAQFAKLPRGEGPLLDAVVMPLAGWQRVDVRLAKWQPQLEAATREQIIAFEKDGARVGVFFGFYRNQRQGAELVNSMNQLSRMTTRDILLLESGYRSLDVVGQPLRVRTQDMRAPEGLIVAWQWYWLDGSVTTSDAKAKFLLAIDRLLGRDDTSAWVTVYVLNPESRAAADRTLSVFVSEMGGALDAALRRVVGQ
jgi:exosortase A